MNDKLTFMGLDIESYASSTVVTLPVVYNVDAKLFSRSNPPNCPHCSAGVPVDGPCEYCKLRAV